MDFSRAAVYELSDNGLVVAAALLVSKLESLMLPMTKWEASFCSSIVDGYKLTPSLSWKQRKTLRGILLKVGGELQHRAEFRKELESALSSLG